MAWTNLTFAFGSTLTSAKMTQMDDNFDALANGDAGAPRIQTAAYQDLSITPIKISAIPDGSATEPKLAAAAVSQGKLKTTTGEVSTINIRALLTLPGGQYGFWPQLRHSTANAPSVASLIANIQYADPTPGLVNEIGISTGNVAYIGLGTSGGTITALQRYVQASPPYDLGDGAIPLFVFAHLRPDGSIASLYVAPEAPWHLNGPTRITPDYYTRDGRPMRRVRQVLAEHGTPAQALARLPRAQVLQRLRTDPLVDIEVTQAVKNADMALLPYPFARAPAGHTVALLDPVAPLMDELLALHELAAPGESVAELLHAGALTLGNTALNRKGPPGVMAVACRWKLTP